MISDTTASPAPSFAGDDERSAACALLNELARGQISRTAACTAMTAAARKRRYMEMLTDA